MSFKEYDIVVTLIEKKSIAKGTIGTVICTFSEPNEAYEVEFVDASGTTNCIETFLPSELRKY